MQERHNSSALSMELYLSCTNPLICIYWLILFNEICPNLGQNEFIWLHYSMHHWFVKFFIFIPSMKTDHNISLQPGPNPCIPRCPLDGSCHLVAPITSHLEPSGRTVWQPATIMMARPGNVYGRQVQLKCVGIVGQVIISIFKCKRNITPVH